MAEGRLFGNGPLGTAKGFSAWRAFCRPIAKQVINKEVAEMKIIPFAFYFLRLHFDVAFGRHYTSHPLDLRWRWSFWKRRRDANRRS